MRTLAGQHLITETAEDTYARTPWAAALASDPPLAGTYGGLYKDLHAPLFQSLPGYLKSTGFRVPADVNDCNMQFCYGKDSNLFHYVGSNPALAASFNDAMECHSKYNLTPWVDLYPTESILADAAEKEGGDSRPLVVDIGGSKGHDLKKFLARHPEVPAGSLVLEDLPDILNGVEESLGSEQKAVTVQPHDFFKPQPAATCGAKVYFMHNVLHDWPDETARRIVETLAPAMEKGYSRLLIHESLVTNVRPLSRITVSDITMMACVAAAERTEEDWKNLIESAGLRLVKIWRPEHSAEGVLEVEVA